MTAQSAIFKIAALPTFDDGVQLEIGYAPPSVELTNNTEILNSTHKICS